MLKIYTTKEGDTWDIISHRLWGQEGLFHHLQKANPKYLGVLVFKGNISLEVPEIKIPEGKTDKLPPWVKG